MFKKAALTIASAGLVLFLAPMSFPGTADAGEQPNILIMGEDANTDTIARNTRTFNRVLRALSTELGTAGFKVYDETGLSMDITEQGRVRRADTELIEIAQTVQSPVDVITIFQIYASASKSAYADVMGLRLRVSGRLLQVQDKRMLGNYEVSYKPKDLPPLPVKCNRDCVLEFVSDQAKKIARDVGAVLVQKLEALSPASAKAELPATVTPAASDPAPVIKSAAPAKTGNCTGLTKAFTLTFTGFKPAEISTIEEYLVAFKGYDHHRPVSTALRQTKYWYETCSDDARLMRNLRLMMEQNEIKGRISQNGNRVEIEKVALVKKR